MCTVTVWTEGERTVVFTDDRRVARLLAEELEAEAHRELGGVRLETFLPPTAVREAVNRPFAERTA